MGWFEDLFSNLGMTKPKPAPTNAGYSATSVPRSTYNSQVPAAARTPAASSPRSQATNALFGPSTPEVAPTNQNDPRAVAGAAQSSQPSSTYNEQVPSQASQPAVSYGNTGQSNSGTTYPSGSGGGGNAAPPVAPAPKPAPPPPPAPPKPADAEAPDAAEWEVLSIPDAQSNAQYVAQMAALKTIMDNYNRQDTGARSDKLTGLNRNLSDLGWVDPDEFQGTKDKNIAGDWDPRGQGSFGRSYVANENDFAGRGATQSGMYSEAIKNMISDYDDRRNDLTDEQAAWTTAQDTALQNQKDKNSTDQGTVKANTVADIAAQLGNGATADMILSGFGSGGARYKRRIDKGAEGDERDYAKTNAKNADELNAASKDSANARRAAAQAIIDQHYARQMANYHKHYG